MITVLIFFPWPLLFGSVDVQFRKIAISYVLRSPLREEIDIIFIIFKLVQRFKVGLWLSLLLDAKFFIETNPPFIRIDIFIVIFDPVKGLLYSHLQLFILAILH